LVFPVFRVDDDKSSVVDPEPDPEGSETFCWTGTGLEPYQKSLNALKCHGKTFKIVGIMKE
jgi:hypothetical protein